MVCLYATTGDCALRLLKKAVSKAAASEGPRRYMPHFVGPFARIMNLGEQKNPACISDFREHQSVR